MIGEQDNNTDWNWVWVDFIENEVDPGLEKDLHELVQLSGTQRNEVETLIWAKELVKCIDPSHEDYFKNWDRKANLSKIMDVCDKIQRDKWIEENWGKKTKWLTTERK